MAFRMWMEGLNPFQADVKTSLQEIDLRTLLGLETISSRMLVRFGPVYAFLALEKTLYTFSVVLDHRKTTTFDADIVSLAANSRHCLVLLSSGRLFRYDPLDDRLMRTEFLGVEGVKDDRANESITHLAAGECVTVACTSLNAVYNIPNKTVTMPKHVRIRKVVAGFEHCLLLTTNGDVYSWGGGLRGQLGNGEIVAPQETPQLVEPLAGVKIVDIGADGWHSAAVSSFGDLYTWGWNNQGQLGLLDPKQDGHVVTQPQLVTFPDGAELTVERVHCGIGHTVVEATAVDGGTKDVLIAGWDLIARFDYQRPTHRPPSTGFRKRNLPDKVDRSSLAVGAGANQIYFLQQPEAE